MKGLPALLQCTTKGPFALACFLRPLVQGLASSVIIARPNSLSLLLSQGCKVIVALAPLSKVARRQPRPDNVSSLSLQGRPRPREGGRERRPTRERRIHVRAFGVKALSCLCRVFDWYIKQTTIVHTAILTGANMARKCWSSRLSQGKPQCKSTAKAEGSEGQK